MFGKKVEAKRLPLFDLSKWAAKITLYYEDDLWGARISAAYRSKYLTGAGNALANSGGGTFALGISAEF